MEFDNLTPFAALAYTAIDVQDQEYRVVALSAAYHLTPDPTRPGCWQPVVIDEDSPPLCMADEAYGEHNQSSVRYESDLAPYKPRCDVILNATAHAPKGRASRRFPVRLRVRRPDTPAPLPDAPQPLNPYIPLSLAQEAAWHAELEKAKRITFPGAVLIDKTLTVTGPRRFKKKWIITRLIQWAIKWSTLTLIRPNPWKLTRPGKTHSLPLRYEHAWGGQCRINERDNRHLIADDPKQQKQRKKLQDRPALAKRVPKKCRLTPEQLAGHPDLNGPVEQLPVAHGVCEHNPIGRGFTEAWFLKASRQKTLTAPQIETPQSPITARSFWQTVRGKLKGRSALVPAGFGSIGRAWLPRRPKAGTYDQRWQDERWPLLPEDFDMGYWNSAPTDQQTDYLAGDETIELINLVAHDTPGAAKDPQGNTQVTVTLPGHRAFVLAQFDNGGLFPLRAVIDTLTIEPEHPDGPRLTCLWRTLAPAALPLARFEARFEVDPKAPLIRFQHTQPPDPENLPETERLAA